MLPQAEATTDSSSSSSECIAPPPVASLSMRMLSTTATARISTTSTRHDEQENEDYYDGRDEADDDLEKNRLKFPTHKLYGRDKELAKLHRIYQRLTSSAAAQVILLPGYSGIGKTSLVREFVKQTMTKERRPQPQETKQEISLDDDDEVQLGTPASTTTTDQRRKPRFVSGKFEELHQSDPYSAIAHGLNELCISLVQPKSNHVTTISTTTTPKPNHDDPSGDGDAVVEGYRTAPLKQGQSKDEKMELRRIRRKLLQSLSEDHIEVLLEVVPHLSMVLNDDRLSTSSSSSVFTEDGEEEIQEPPRLVSKPSILTSRAKRLQYAFTKFIKVYCSSSYPLIFFLDDLQWADDGSLQLLSSLLTDSKLQYLMFIGSYRSNEVSETHPVQGVLSEVNKYRENVEYYEVSDLQKHHIGQFIADTLHLDVDEVESLTQALYNKTLGNIFFTIQGLEELVRQNGLYYDIMMFRWEWNMSKIENEDLLCGDVVDMVQSKIKHLPDLLQQILTIASHTRFTFDVDLLLELLDVISDGTMTSTSQQEVVTILDQAVEEGLLLCLVAGEEYRFAHDRIQEAASAFVTDDARDRLCFQIGTVLIDRIDDSKGFALSSSSTSSRTSSTSSMANGNARNKRRVSTRSNPYITTGTTAGTIGVDDWMLFTAVHHFNSIPFQYLVSASNGITKIAQIRLARFNLRAAKLSIGKSAFPQAVQFLLMGETCLQDNQHGKWKEHYEFCLDLYNHKMEVEFSLGHHTMAQEAVNEVLQNANKTIGDKSLAEFYNIEIITNRQDRNYNLAVQQGVEYLNKSHGIKMPVNPGPTTVFRETMKLQRIQGRRDLLNILELPPMKETQLRIMRLLEQLVRASIYVSNNQLCAVVSLIGERLSFEYGSNKYLAILLAHHATLHRQKERYDAAYQMGYAAFEMLNQLSSGSSWVRGVNALCGCILPLRSPVAKSIEPLYEAHKVGIACGDVEWACTSAMQYALCYYCAGWPLNAPFENQLTTFDEEAHRFAQPPSMTATFCIFRQTLWNLQGKGNNLNPCVFVDGKAMNEDQILATMEGSTRKQTFRDISIFRLMLACIFEDDEIGKEMVDRLVTYPDFDFPIARHHLRDSFIGLMAFQLGRKLKNRKYTRLGRNKIQQFQRLARSGSENAPAILACLRAEERPSQDRYEAAIEACSNAGFTHLEAVISERCGMYHLSKKDQRSAEVHLSEALWLYNDWGAVAKVDQLKQKYHFLWTARRTRKSASSTFYTNAMSGCLSFDDGSTTGRDQSSRS